MQLMSNSHLPARPRQNPEPTSIGYSVFKPQLVIFTKKPLSLLVLNLMPPRHVPFPLPHRDSVVILSPGLKRNSVFSPAGSPKVSQRPSESQALTAFTCDGPTHTHILCKLAPFFSPVNENHSPSLPPINCRVVDFEAIRSEMCKTD